MFKDSRFEKWTGSEMISLIRCFVIGMWYHCVLYQSRKRTIKTENTVRDIPAEWELAHTKCKLMQSRVHVYVREIFSRCLLRGQWTYFMQFMRKKIFRRYVSIIYYARIVTISMLFWEKSIEPFFSWIMMLISI